MISTYIYRTVNARINLNSILGLQNEIIELRGTIQSREFDLEKSRVAFERSKKDFEGLQDSYDQLKADLDKARKTYHEQREKFELEQTELKEGVIKGFSLFVTGRAWFFIFFKLKASP